MGITSGASLLKYCIFVLESRVIIIIIFIIIINNNCYNSTHITLLIIMLEVYHFVTHLRFISSRFPIS